MKKDDFKELLDKIETSLEDLISQLKELGMKDNVIKKFLEGEEVIMCPYCQTMNMMEVEYDKNRQLSVYKCFFCHKTIVKDEKK